MINLVSSSPSQTMALGVKLAPFLKGNEVILLRGDLAAGKTTFTKGLAQGLGIKNIITSPTFVICKEYQGNHYLNHLDLYRLQEMGLDYNLLDYLNNGISVIEWPDNLAQLIPSEYINITFKITNNEERTISFTATTPALEAIINEAFSN